MLIFGSSSINGRFGHLMAEDFLRLGFRVTRLGYSSAGLARPDFRDLHEMLGRLPIVRNRTSVVLYIGGNDAQSLWLRPEERGEDDEPWVHWTDARWPTIYESRATDLISSLCKRGVLHTIVLPPVDVSVSRLQKRLDRLRPLLQSAAQATHCGRFVSTRGDLGHFFADGEAQRAGDGVHMTRAGAERVWGRVRDSVLASMTDSVAQLN